MILPILGLGVCSFVLSWILTYAMIRIAPRLGFVDKPGGRKIHSNPKPLGGGVAIFWAFALPMLAALLWVHMRAIALRSPSILVNDPDAPYVIGAAGRTRLALGILAA